VLKIHANIFLMSLKDVALIKSNIIRTIELHYRH